MTVADHRASAVTEVQGGPADVQPTSAAMTLDTYADLRVVAGRGAVADGWRTFRKRPYQAAFTGGMGERWVNDHDHARS